MVTLNGPDKYNFYSHKSANSADLPSSVGCVLGNGAGPILNVYTNPFEGTGYVFKKTDYQTLTPQTNSCTGATCSMLDTDTQQQTTGKISSSGQCQ